MGSQISSHLLQSGRFQSPKVRLPDPQSLQVNVLTYHQHTAPRPHSPCVQSKRPAPGSFTLSCPAVPGHGHAAPPTNLHFLILNSTIRLAYPEPRYANTEVKASLQRGAEEMYDILRYVLRGTVAAGLGGRWKRVRRTQRLAISVYRLYRTVVLELRTKAPSRRIDLVQRHSVDLLASKRKQNILLDCLRQRNRHKTLRLYTKDAGQLYLVLGRAIPFTPFILF